MGMIGTYIALEEGILHKVLQGEADLLDFDPAQVDSIDIDKAWQGILFLLCHEIADGEPPLGYIVPLAGEQRIENCEMDFGAFYLTATQVQQALAAIKPYTREQLWAQFDWPSFVEEEIYPVMSDENGDAFFDYLYSYIEAIREFFEKVAAEQKAIVFFIS